MRTFAIGDVHGCRSALETLVGVLNLQPDDRLITLGDYVDRGPDSAGVLDYLLALKSKCELVNLRGNHEMMMLAARTGRDNLRFWLNCGGESALMSYGKKPWDEPTLKDIPRDHWDFLRHTCIDFCTDDRHIYVHANLHPNLDMEEQSSEWLHWEFLKPNMHYPHKSGKTMICGHSERRDGVPLVLKKAICIDTWAYGGGWLTGLCLDDYRYWQANELGEIREGKLEIENEDEE